MKPLPIAAALIVIVGLAGCKVSTPGKLETSVVTEIKRKVTIGGKNWKNPEPDTAESAKEGGEHFQHHCQICHGLDGQSTGVPFAEKMSPPVANLASEGVQAYSDGQLKWIIENGVGPSGMPGWKGILEDDEMWKMVRYLRHLPAKGSLGAPAIFNEESEEHEAMEKMEKDAKPHTHSHSHK